jgi:hypothetical protein
MIFDKEDSKQIFKYLIDWIKLKNKNILLKKLILYEKF